MFISSTLTGMRSTQPQTLARPNPRFPASFITPAHTLERSAPQPVDRAVPKAGRRSSVACERIGL